MEKEFISAITEEQLMYRFEQAMLNFVASRAKKSLKEVVDHHFSKCGKYLRPKVVFEISRVLGLDPLKSMDWAIACEVLHNATLVHDDLQDGDQIRRGIPTVWSEFGKNMAINAGDYLMLLAPLSISQSQLDNDIKLKLLDLFAKMSTDIVSGQCREFELNSLDSKNLKEDYLECIRGKTSALFSGLAMGTAIIAGLTENKAAMLSEVFCSLGTIFQIQDDILDLYGEKLRDGQGNDIKEGKVSYLVVSHLENCPNDRFLVKELLFKPRELTTQQDIDWFKNLLKNQNTFEMCITEFCTRIDTLLSNQILDELPGLKKIVINLLEKVVRPIEHVITPLKEGRYAETIQ